MAVVEVTQILEFGYLNEFPEVAAQAGTGVSANDDDDMLFIVRASEDCGLLGIDMNFPVGSTVSAILASGLDLLDEPAMELEGTRIELVDAAKAALVDNASVGAGKKLKATGKGELLIFISGAVAGRKRVTVSAEPARRKR